MLLELAVGDAYGAGFEFADRDIVERENDLRSFRAHPYHKICVGCYTDDTQMSVAIAEGILSDEPWTPEMLADRFVAAFRRDPRLGYSKRIYRILSESLDGSAFLARVTPFSNRSGAAMRAAPISVFPTAETVIERCTIQAKITHDTRDGIAAALATALAAHYFLYNLGPKRKLADFLETWVPGYDWSKAWTGWVGVEGLDCVRAAVTAVATQDGLADILRTAVSFGGDVDTVAAIALAIGSCSREIPDDLPPPLIAGLENGVFGRDYLRQLDERLLRLK